MRTPVVWSVIAGFLLGVFISSYTSLSVALCAGALLVALLCMLFGATRRIFLVLLAAVVLASFVLGGLRMQAVRIIPDERLTQFEGIKIAGHGVVIAEPDIRDRSVRITIELDTVGAQGVPVPVAARVLAIAPAHTDIAYGDVVELTGTLRMPEAFESADGRSFNYPKFLEGRGITHEVAFAQIETVGHAGNRIKESALVLKSAYLRGLRAVLPEPYAGLAGGITVGDKRSVGTELSDVFQSVSLVHILVLSGYNITLVLSGFSRVLTRAPRYLQLLGTALVVVFFYLISGGAATAVRAGAMAYLGVYARLSGRIFFAVRVLGVVALCMVAWNPYILAFDPGFQLSVLATLGLVLFTPLISRRLPFVSERFGLREIAASSLATQLSVLPLLLYQNGMLSIVSLPANLFALIAVPFAMIFSAVAAVAGIVFGTWGALIAFPAYIALAYIVLVAEFFAAFPFATATLPPFSAWWLIPIYTLIVLVYVLAQKQTAGEKPAV